MIPDKAREARVFPWNVIGPVIACGFFDVSGNITCFAHISSFIMGLILAFTIGRRRRKAWEARMRL
jgi:membrane associated rhomboid family serine protease